MKLFEQGTFQIPANVTPEMAKEMIAERRKRLKDGRANYGSARYVGEGIGHALNGAFVGMGNSKIDKRENDLAQMIMERARQNNIPAYQNGTMNHPGGLALVGEQGPEVVNMPPGAQVFPNPDAPIGRFDGSAELQMFRDMSPKEKDAFLRRVESGLSVSEALQPDGWTNQGMVAPEMAPAPQMQGGNMGKNPGTPTQQYIPSDFNAPTDLRLMAGHAAGQPNAQPQPMFPSMGRAVSAAKDVRDNYRDDYDPNMVQGGGGVSMVDGGAGEDALNGEPVPTPQELSELAASAGFDPESLRGMDLNATEARNLGLTLRMMQAESTLRPIQNLGTNFKERALEWLPGQTMENAIYGAGALGTDPKYQQYINARDSFANAALRADTGATINESELPAIIKESMPLPGDSEDTIALKQRTREARIRALIAGSGPASAVLPQPGQPIIPQTEMSDDEFLKSLGLN